MSKQSETAELATMLAEQARAELATIPERYSPLGSTAAVTAPARNSIKSLECFTFCVAVACAIVDAFGRAFMCLKMADICGAAFVPEDYIYLVFGGAAAVVGIRQSAKGAKGLMGVNKTPPAGGG